jgi:O-antigen/teichoic acid export membrane protein
MFISAITFGWSGAKRVFRNPIALNTMPIAGASFIGAAIGMATNVVAARLLGPTDFGLVVIITTYPTLLGALFGVKSSSISTQYIAKFRATGKSAELLTICKFGYVLDLLVAIVTMSLVALTGSWVAEKFFDIAGTGWLMFAYSMSFLSWPLLGTSVAVLSSFERFGWLAGVHILGKMIECVVVIALLFAGFGVTGFVLGVAASNILVGLVALQLASLALKREAFDSWWRASLTEITQFRKELVGLFRWNYVELTFSGLLEHVPLMLLGILRGPADAGFYRVARSMVMACSYLEAAMSKVAYPLLASISATKGLEELNAQVKRWTLTVGLGVGAAVLLVIPLLPFIITTVFGHQYSPMVLGVQIMTIACAINAICFWLYGYFYASQNVAFWTKAGVIHTLVVIVLAGFVINHWGYLGMATLGTVGKVMFTLTLAMASARLPRSSPGASAGATVR